MKSAARRRLGGSIRPGWRSASRRISPFRRFGFAPPWCLARSSTSMVRGFIYLTRTAGSSGTIACGMPMDRLTTMPASSSPTVTSWGRSSLGASSARDSSRPPNHRSRRTCARTWPRPCSIPRLLSVPSRLMPRRIRHFSPTRRICCGNCPHCESVVTKITSMRSRARSSCGFPRFAASRTFWRFVVVMPMPWECRRTGRAIRLSRSAAIRMPLSALRSWATRPSCWRATRSLATWPLTTI